MTYYVLIAAVTLQALSGIAGGFGLVVDPSGEAIGLPAEWLAGTPFLDYRVPGLILLLVLGAGPLAVAWGLWRSRPWAWYGSIGTGGGLTVWILVEILMIGYQPEPPLQLVYGVLGIGILLLGSRRSVRGRFPGLARSAER